MTESSPLGRHISRVPGKPVVRGDDGRDWLRQNGRFDGDVALRLAPQEAELLHAQLCFALGDEPVTRPPVPGVPAPECRFPVPGLRGSPPPR